MNATKVGQGSVVDKSTEIGKIVAGVVLLGVLVFLISAGFQAWRKSSTIAISQEQERHEEMMRKMEAIRQELQTQWMVDYLNSK